jgi:hypothetical protein
MSWVSNESLMIKESNESLMIKESNASKKSILGYPIFIGSSIYKIGTLGVQGGLEMKKTCKTYFWTKITPATLNKKNAFFIEISKWCLKVRAP